MSKNLNKQKNDDTKTKLGDIYHYYIALSYCLDLQENETILIEKYGDISLESNENSLNMEVKHHAEKHELNDRNIDFWKTLKNWIFYHENMRNFKKLILYTTSEFGSKSSLELWNSSTTDERLKILKEIGKEKKTKEDTFRPLYTFVFQQETEIILSILEKIEIYTSQTNIESIEKKIMKNSFFKSIKAKDRQSFVKYLMGYILTMPTSKPYKWEITCEYFESIACDIRDRFTENSGGLKVPLENSISKEEEENFKNRKFVREIEEIRYDKKIATAISNYWRAQNTILNSAIGNPIFNVDLGEFQEDIKETLEENKLSFKDDCDELDQEDIILKSKRLYDKAMDMPVNNYCSINPNRPFFQKGIIHKVVEERGFSWHMMK
ncbi:hypothetical protein PO903_18860 [Paenibacillus sp. PK4536]|uniref:ABC-three component system protein n=1 Tax=Paenibacillus sp. PK4536 TaxID=3024576 RepID=UPI00235835F4|nr:ABC-three component system protein [Paenibacillus sp. PK4536]WIM38690.1 hypothetical protein PO903_18860 [Paenibacillus sp. PK4536]